MIKAILLDLDLTLLDRDAMFRNYAYELTERYAPKTVSAEEAAETAEALILRDEKGYGKTVDMYQPIIDAWHLDATVQDMIDGWGRFMEYGVVVYPHVQDVLISLKKQYKLGLVTNGYSDIQRKKVKGAGLTEFWDTIVVSEDIGISKPDAAIFLTALNRLGITPEEAVFVGDHYEKDILGAMNVGMRTVWVDHGEEGNEYSGLKIDKIEQLPEVLKQYE